MNKEITQEERAKAREYVADLFEIDSRGCTEELIRGTLRLKLPGLRKQNVVKMGWLFKLCEWYRKTAPYALPNGEVLDYTRAEIDAHFGEPTDWYWFCGMKEDQRGKLPPIYFFRDPDRNPPITPARPPKHSRAKPGPRRRWRTTTGK